MRAILSSTSAMHPSSQSVLHSPHVHRLGMWRGSESQSARRALRNLGRDDRAVLRTLHRKRFLGVADEADSCSRSRQSSQIPHPTGRSTGRSARPKTKPLGSPAVQEWRRGELNPRPRAVHLERLRSLVRDLISPPRRPRTGSSEASSSDFSSAAVRAPAAAYPDLRRLSRPYGLEPVRRRSP